MAIGLGAGQNVDATTPWSLDVWPYEGKQHIIGMHESDRGGVHAPHSPMVLFSVSKNLDGPFIPRSRFMLQLTCRIREVVKRFAAPTDRRCGAALHRCCCCCLITSTAALPPPRPPLLPPHRLHHCRLLDACCLTAARRLSTDITAAADRGGRLLQPCGVVQLQLASWLAS